VSGRHRLALPFVRSADEEATVAAALKLLEREARYGAPLLDSPAAVRDLFRLRLGGLPHEAFAVAYVDAVHRLIEVEELFRGTLTQTSVFPREVVKGALRVNAAAVFFAHNHPSGTAEPSAADQALTGTLKAALLLVDVKTLDHFIVTAGGTMSFAERGLL
jgi:DNA repair protein RadC